MAVRESENQVVFFSPSRTELQDNLEGDKYIHPSGCRFTGRMNYQCANPSQLSVSDPLEASD